MGGYPEPGEVLVEDHDGVVVVRLIGEHDLATCQAVKDVLARQIGAGRGVVVSLTETRFIDSTVLHRLFDADALLREHDRRLAVCVNTASIVRRVLDIVCFDQAVYCTASQNEAIEVAGSLGTVE